MSSLIPKNLSDSFCTPDLINDDLAQKYFAAVGLWRYYISIKRVFPKREISTEFISHGMLMLQCIDVPNKASILESFVLAGSVVSRECSKKRDYETQSLRNIYPEGWDILGLTSPLDEDVLKKMLSTSKHEVPS